jgi:hypothetical protein
VEPASFNAPSAPVLSHSRRLPLTSARVTPDSSR